MVVGKEIPQKLENEQYPPPPSLRKREYDKERIFLTMNGTMKHLTRSKYSVVDF
jgi:hypothetical protein